MIMMTSSHVATRNAQDLTGELSQSERYELDQYEKIVRFCNDIFSGEHPSIKLPADQTPIDAVTLENTLREASKRAQESRASAPKQPARVNAIFLEKSDELVCAEIQLERQRLERSIRDELEEQRAVKHVPTDAWSSLDLSDILSKALALTGANDAENGGASGQKRANNDNASDSFDDNTFYSSTDDFLSSQPATARNTRTKSKLSKNTTDDARESSPYSPVYNATPAQPASVPANPIQVPGLNPYNPGTANIQQWVSSYLAMVQAGGQPANPSTAPNTSAAYGVGPSSNPYTGMPPAEAARSAHGPERKKSKKKKRKADREAMNTAPSPRIKAEPRSVSPMAGPSQVRPNKRQRQTHDQGQDTGYDPEYSNLSGSKAQGNYQRYNEPSSRPADTTVVPQPRYLTNALPPRWIEQDGGYAGEQVDYSGAHGSRHAPNVHGVAPQNAQAPVYRDARLGPGESLEVRHYPARIAVDGYPEAHAQPRRIYVDSYGREYIEPQPQLVHQAVAPITTEQGYNAILQRTIAGQQAERPFDSGRAVYGGQAPAYAPPHNNVIAGSESQAADNRYRGYSEHPISQAQLVIQAAQQGSEIASNPVLRATSMHPGATQGHDGGNIPPYLRTYAHAPGHPASVDYNGRPNAARGDGYASRGVAYLEQPRDVGHQLPYSNASRERMYR